MIPIIPQSEPIDFDSSVRQPGASFLASVPAPKSKEWRKHEYWSRCLILMYRQYGKICAYCATWIPIGVQSKVGDTASVDHYLPKHKHPHLAYEWSNYRLASTRLNSYKDTYQDVLDPFTIGEHWFVIDFRSMKISPSKSIHADIARRVEQTIKRLKLNDDAELVQQRFDRFSEYYKGNFTIEYLRQYAPFIASEIQRQKIQPGMPIGEP